MCPPHEAALIKKHGWQGALWEFFKQNFEREMEAEFAKLQHFHATECERKIQSITLTSQQYTDLVRSVVPNYAALWEQARRGEQFFDLSSHTRALGDLLQNYCCTHKNKCAAPNMTMPEMFLAERSIFCHPVVDDVQSQLIPYYEAELRYNSILHAAQRNQFIDHLSALSAPVFIVGFWVGASWFCKRFSATYKDQKTAARKTFQGAACYLLWSLMSCYGYETQSDRGSVADLGLYMALLSGLLVMPEIFRCCMPDRHVKERV
jgi:hypothetical protein